MTDDKVLEAMYTAWKRLSHPYHYDRVTPEQLRHIASMRRQVANFVQEGRREKAMRWLGFVQGVAWALGVASIEDLQHDSMPDGVEYDPAK